MAFDQHLVFRLGLDWTTISAWLTMWNMSYMIQTAPKTNPIALSVVERIPGQMERGQQLPDILSFTCQQQLQFDQLCPPMICDDNGDLYKFIPVSTNGTVHSGYIHWQKRLTPQDLQLLTSKGKCSLTSK